MADEDFIVRFYFDTQQAERDAAKMANRLASISAILKDLGQDTKYVDQAANSMAKFAGATDKTSNSVTKNSAAVRRLALDNDLVRQAASGNAEAIARLTQLQGQAIEANKRFNNSQADSVRQLASTRYALFDVSNALAIAGAAMIALPVLAAGVGIAWERDFANVVRTSTARTAEDIDALRSEFIALAQELPITFQELTKIGTLGGQLGISTEGIENFTRVVAQLVATTDLSVDSAATALGRFKALLGVSEGDFDELASSILRVGVNSVATESQIVAISTQISSMGAFAGLTAQDVVGLAGALASVGAQPELSRGTITRVFTLISRAVATSGDDLERFAELSGRSVREFKNAFGTADFGDVFVDFLGGIRNEGQNAVATLNELGVSSVRDVPLLLRLANAADQAGQAGRLLGESMELARSGWSDNSELGEQFGIIAETTASKLQVLQNSFQALLSVLGEQGLGPIKFLIDQLTILIQRATELADNPVAQWAIFLIGTLTVLAGIIGLTVAVALRAVGGILAVTQAMQAFGVQAGISTVSYSTMLGALAATGPVGAGAVRAIGLVTTALKALAAATLVLAVPEFTKTLSNYASDAYGFTNNLQGAVSGVLSEVDQLNSLLDMNQVDIDFLQIGDNVFGAWGQFRIALNATDDEFEKLIRGGNIQEFQKQMGQIQLVSGRSFNELLKAFPGARAALQEVANGSNVTASALLSQADAEAQAALEAENLANKLGLVPEELATLQKNIQTGSSGFVNFGDLIQRVQDQTRGFAEKTSKEVYGSIDSWQEFYDGSSVDIYAFMALLDQQIANQATWADDIAELTARGATSFVTELAKMGPEGAPLAAAAVNLTKEELLKLEDQAALAAFLASEAFAQTFTNNTPMLIAAYSAGGIEAVQAMIVALRTGDEEVRKVQEQYGITSAENPIPIYADSTEAQNEVTRFMNYVSSQTVTIGVRARSEGSKPKQFFGGSYEYEYASGGAVHGPGTGTSDSIAARLSNGEYVIRASAVRQYGAPLFDALNRGVARFASGGMVGGRNAATAGSFSSITELGPRSLAAIRGVARQEMYAVLAASPAQLANYVGGGNRSNANQGRF